jgi:ABC-2 type transport system ATP-binding protein
MNIVISNLSKKIRDTIVLSNVNLSFQSGTIYGLCGENGSGKTMLMRAICGLILPTSGTVCIDGKVLGRDIDFPNDTGILIENPAFVSNMSAFDNLKLLSSIRDVSNEKSIREYIKKVGLDPDSKKKYKKFSLGMKQKLGIAAAFFEENELIILDEPYNALDEDSIEPVNNLIREAKERGAIVILASHNKELLTNIADILIKLKGGTIEK